MPRARVNPETGLTQRQEVFCVLYVTGDSKINGNGTACYRRAFQPKTATDATIAKKASALLDREHIRRRIGELREKVAEKAAVTAAEALKIAANLARADIRKLYHEDGRLKAPHELDDETAAALASIEVAEIAGDDKTVVVTKKVKLWDKNAALDRLFKHLGLFEKDNAQTGNAIALAFLVPGKDKD